ncbi:hypothetical protein HQ560_13030 [bacterium]|nr:hypothetical protein [bacterium]
MATFKHFGVPTQTVQENETYIEGAKVYVTDPDANEYKIEFVRCEAGCPMPEIIQTTPHAAYMVDDLAAAMAGKEEVLAPFEATDTLRVAFIKDGDALIELMEEI